jgi:proteasome lid subunit RPN8/RPN11
MKTAQQESAADLIGRLQGRVVGTLYRDAVVTLVHESILEQIIDYSEIDLRRERGGFLLGSVQTEEPAFIEIRHFLPAVEARSKAASLTFTHETWATLTRQAEERFPDAVILGWQHTHPGFGIFLSAYDLFIQRHFFSQTWQVALVVDPVRKELGFFQWRDGDVRDCGFVCVEG